MKKSIKQLSKSTLAVVLSLCMLISCAAVGIVATDAAKVKEQQAVAASVDKENVGVANGSITDYGVAGSFNNWDTSTRFDDVAGVGSFDIWLEANTTYEFKITYNGTEKSYGADTTISVDQLGEHSFTIEEGNATLETYMEGYYKFTLYCVDMGDGAVSLGIFFPIEYGLSGSFNNWDTSTRFFFDGNTPIYPVYLSANTTYYFKITYNGTEKSYGANTIISTEQSEYDFNVSDGNATLKTSEEGYYFFALNYPDDGDGVVNGGISFPHSYYGVSGSFNDWSTSAKFDGNKYYIQLEANTTYEFKITRNGTEKSYGANTTISTEQSGYDFNVSDGNATLKTSAAGTYTFTLNSVDDGDGVVNVGITFPPNNYGVSGSFNDWSTSAKFDGNKYSIQLEANTTYEFKITRNGTEKSYGANTTFSSSQSEYYFNTNQSSNATLKTSEAGYYTFTINSVDDGDGAVNVGITFPHNSSSSKYDYGVSGSFNDWDSTARFNNDGTFTVSLSANSTYDFKITYNGTEKSYGANATFSSSQSEYYFNTNQSSNATLKTSAAGEYKFTINSVDDGDGAVNVGIKFPRASTSYTISKAAASNGSFSVSQTTAAPGTKVYVYTTPDRGYVVDKVTAKGGYVLYVYNPETNIYYFEMHSPDCYDVTVTVTFKPVTSRTLTAQVTSGTGTVTLTLSRGDTVYSAVTTSGTTQSSITAYDGETLTITASAGSGYQLKNLTRSGIDVSSGRRWIVSANADVKAIFTKPEYSNWYTATPGSTTSGMYTKVKATFFDYYTDGEFNNGWYSGIQNSERGETQDTCTPYSRLNFALSNYARSKGVTYPVYFGNFNDLDDCSDDTNNQAGYNFYNEINSSYRLNNTSNSVTGLTGKKLSANGLPTHYSAAYTDENGVEMKQFDRNWLSEHSQNLQGKLASIVDSPFPVKSTNVTYGTGSHTYYSFNSESDNLWFSNLRGGKYAYLDTTAISGDSTWYAYLWNSNDTSQNTWVQAVSTDTSKLYKFTNPDPSTYNKVIFVRTNGSPEWNEDTTRANNKTADLNWPSGGNNWLLYKTSLELVPRLGYAILDGSWHQYSDDVANTTPTVEYSTNDSDAVYSPNYGRRGFFPFDHSHAGTSSTDNRAWDLGFGVSMEIKFTLGPDGKTADGAPQIFEYSGDDDLWVYLDDELILDLGGDHFKSTGKIDFASKTVTATQTQKAPNSSATRNTSFDIDYSRPHTLKIFYLERGMSDSNLMFGFSMYPYDDNNTYEVENNVVYTNGLNPGLANQFETTFTFTNTSVDGKGANAAYTNHKASNGEEVSPGGTTDTSGQFNLIDGRYDRFTNIFTVNNTLRTQESISGYYQYDTSYRVIDTLNNNRTVKAGNGTDTGDFNYMSSVDGADPELDVTGLRTVFTNKLKTTSFILKKDLDNNSYYDSQTEFPFTLKLYMDDPNGGMDNIDFTVNGKLQYKSSLDGYTTTRTLPSDGIGIIHEGECLLFEGIPAGAKLRVYEPTVNADYTPDIEGTANCYKAYDIKHSNSYNPAKFTSFPEDSNRNRIAEVTLDSSDTITMYDKLKTYKVEYKLPTRLYGDKIYKLPVGKLTPAMVDAGYASVNNNDHTVSLTKAFVNAHIPYESIFMKNINWNANNTSFELGTHDCDAYYYLAATENDACFSVEIDLDGDEEFDELVTGLRCGQSIMKDPDNNEYFSGTKAGETPSYWKIYDADTLKYVATCYSQDFYYVAYGNYYIYAVYGEGSGYDLYDKEIGSTVINLGVTRSHWNNTVSGDDDPNTYTYYGKTKTYNYYHKDTEYDRLYLDMALAFNCNGKMINKYSSQDIKVGYEICQQSNHEVDYIFKDIVIDNTDLDNKNRIHVYYGFINSYYNRDAQGLAIRAYVSVNGGDKVYSNLMPFELGTEGYK